MRKELLLAVAFEEFAQSGYHTTLSQIGKRAGIKKQTIYNYFENKDDLLYEVIAQEINTFYAAKIRDLDRLMGLTPEEILRSIFFQSAIILKIPAKVRFWRWLFMIESTDLFEKIQGFDPRKRKELLYQLKKK
jgi:Transcriptional regulator